ncbi:hypothetical protein BDV11DRAFT_210298 [Aspergillus similis]
MSTILLVGVFLFADEKIPLSLSLKRALYFTIIASSVITSVLYPPDFGLTIVTYANAFLSVAFALRAIELLVVNQPRQLKRLVKVHDSTSLSIYIWESMPPALSFPRLLWTCDLLLNPRGIGWAHGSNKYLPELEKLSAKSATPNSNGPHLKQRDDPVNYGERFVLRRASQNRLSFLAKEAIKLFIAYFAFDVYRTWFGRNYAQLCANFQALVNSDSLQHFGSNYLGFELHISPEASEEFVRRFLLPPACWLACYGFIDGIRAAIALLAVGGLYLVSPTLAAEPWMYPSIFDIWGKLWHDLCRRALVSTSTVLIPQRTPASLRRFLVGSLSFILSGFVHSAGTYAVIRDAHAVFMMMVFFILLPFFIAAQEAVSTHTLERFLPASALTSASIWSLDAAYIICARDMDLLLGILHGKLIPSHNPCNRTPQFRTRKVLPNTTPLPVQERNLRVVCRRSAVVVYASLSSNGIRVDPPLRTERVAVGPPEFRCAVDCVRT